MKFLIGFADPQQTGLEVEIKEGKTIIGRNCQRDGYDHALDLTQFDAQGQVSACHATIDKDGEKMLLQDEGSTNGTYLINPVDGSHTKVESGRMFPIRVGDTFVIGSVVIRVVN